MRRYSTVTPEGARDILFEECRALREAQERLSRLFSLWGYHEVLTPGLEFFDVFNLPGAAIPQQEMYKSTDNKGRLLVFRPDSTLPIARMTASRLQNQPRPLRLYYNQSVFRNRPDLSGRSDECRQMGIELLGMGGLRADLEAISLAAQALSAFTEEYRIEIGHARLFSVLAEGLPLSLAAKEELRSAIESKNYGALSEMLDPLGNLPAAAVLKRLPRLFGGEEVFEEAQELFTGQESSGILAELRQLYTALKALTRQDQLMVDLGLVQRNDYYSGPVFSAYVPGRGEAVLSGGRYDHLCEKFGPSMPAVGFALELDALARFAAGGLSSPEVLVHGEPGFETKALKLAGELSAQGVCCETSVFDDWHQARAYARLKGIPGILRVADTVSEILTAGEEGAL